MGNGRFPRVNKEDIWAGLGFFAVAATVILIAPRYAFITIIAGAIAAVSASAFFDHVRKNKESNSDSED